MPIRTLYIIGAGGHAKVVIDAFRKSPPSEVAIQVCDDSPARQGSKIAGLLVQAPPSLSEMEFHVAVGANAIRHQRFEQIIQHGGTPRSIIHPMSAIASSATVGAGSFTAAFATVGPESLIGEGAIINHGAVVDHDCILGDFCHIAPGSVVGGGVTIGHRVLIGSGAIILAGLTLASDIVIGAGAVVTRSIDKAGTFIGVPAKEVHRG